MSEGATGTSLEDVVQRTAGLRGRVDALGDYL